MFNLNLHLMFLMGIHAACVKADEQALFGGLAVYPHFTAYPQYCF